MGTTGPRTDRRSAIALLTSNGRSPLGSRSACFAARLRNPHYFPYRTRSQSPTTAPTKQLQVQQVRRKHAPSSHFLAQNDTARLNRTDYGT